MTRSFVAVLVPVCLLAALGNHVLAQCEPIVTRGPGYAGTDGAAVAITRWDPDGAGAAAPVVVLGGSFQIAGDRLVNRVAMYDPVARTFGPLGAGFDGNVTCLAVAANGDLLAGGSFTTAGGVPASGVARWHAGAWQPLGSGIPVLTYSWVTAIAGMPNGDVVAGGSFTSAGGVAVAGLARWDGTAWSPIAGLATVAPGTPSVLALLVEDDGDLIVGGQFTHAGSLAASAIARWDGAAWSSLAGGVSFPFAAAPAVRALAKLPGGAFTAGGSFQLAGGVLVNHVARWDGASWSAFGAGMGPTLNENVRSLSSTPAGELFASGSFLTAGGVAVNHVAKWTAGAWIALSGGAEGNTAAVFALTGDDVILGSGWQMNAPRRWRDGAWEMLTSGFASEYAAGCTPLLRLADGRLLFGVHHMGGAQTGYRGVATFDGTTWALLGGGVGGYVTCAVQLGNGDVVVGGHFAEAGGVPAGNVARWNGTAWAALGAPSTDSYLVDLEVLPNGDVIAAGLFTTIGGVPAPRIARWDGSTWSSLGGGCNGAVASIQRAPNGDLVAAGSFTSAGGVAANRVARWDGAQWSALGSGPTHAVTDLVFRWNGDLVAAGLVTPSGGVPAPRLSAWNGSTWSPVAPVPDGLIEALALLPNGDVVAGGRFANAGGQPASRLARWDGAQWSPLLSAAFGAQGYVSSLLVLPEGELLAGGSFKTLGGDAAVGFVRLRTPCPATVSSWGTGCAGAGGVDGLTASTSPWLGGTFTATATGLPANAITLALYGFGTLATPLAAVLPQAAPGCTLRVTPDALQVLLPSGGEATTTLALPRDPALVGIVVHAQAATLELDGGGAIAGATTSNRLSLTLGTFF